MTFLHTLNQNFFLYQKRTNRFNTILRYFPDELFLDLLQRFLAKCRVIQKELFDNQKSTR